MTHPESVKAWEAETDALREEILRLLAALKTAENTAKINLSVAKQRGEEIDRLRLVIAHEGDCTQAADDEAMRRGHEIERLRAELKWVADQRWNEHADLDDICFRADCAIAEPTHTKD